MALIGMACWDTEENRRSWMTERTLESLYRTVDWTRHRLIVSDNDSCQESHDIYAKYLSIIPGMKVIFNGTNLGTARAINKTWEWRKPGQHAIKIDNDVVIHDIGWLDRLEECVEREPRIGIIGLKRKDLAETPNCPVDDWRHSELIMLPHEPGQTWMVVERCGHILGTCQLYSHALIDKIGFLYQMGGKYSYDDCIGSIRSAVAGFWNCFYPHVRIDHIDPGGDEATKWKQDYAATMTEAFNRVKMEYATGKRSVYQGPMDD